jgi:hypothetical protein
MYPVAPGEGHQLIYIEIFTVQTPLHHGQAHIDIYLDNSFQYECSPL